MSIAISPLEQAQVGSQADLHPVISFVGDTVGVSVGDTVGVSVGVTVGSVCVTVGVTVGVYVGVYVGVRVVGITVGVTVGAASVGVTLATVTHSHSSSPLTTDEVICPPRPGAINILVAGIFVDQQPNSVSLSASVSSYQQEAVS